MLTPSQDLICSFVYRENKQSSRWMQIGQHNSQLDYETASCPANVIQQNVLAHAQTSALKHHLNKTRAEGYDRRSAAACLPLSQSRSRKISWSFVCYNRIIVAASCLLAATLICRLRGDNRSGRLCFSCANQLLCSEPGTIDSPAFSSKDGSKNPSEAPPQKHKCFKHVLQLSTLYCEARAKIIKNHWVLEQISQQCLYVWQTAKLCT